MPWAKWESGVFAEVENKEEILCFHCEKINISSTSTANHYLSISSTALNPSNLGGPQVGTKVLGVKAEIRICLDCSQILENGCLAVPFLVKS